MNAVSADEYPSRCTGCDDYVHETEDSPPCPNCFPGLGMTRADAVAAGMSDERIAEEFGSPTRQRAPAASSHEVPRDAAAAGTRV